MKTLSFLALSLALIAPISAQDIVLPAAQKTGGMPLMEALAKRSSTREFSARTLTQQQLGDLLWAGFGVNRPDGKRTAPSASNSQEVEIYVLMQQGAYVYDAAKHLLRQVSTEDLRAQIGKAMPAVSIVFVGDLTKRKSGSPESKKNVANIDSAYISENLYLYCASEGLATHYHGVREKKELPGKLQLRAEQEILAAQSVGFPAGTQK